MKKRRKIKPLLAIMSPRDIPWIEEKISKIDYVDKVWFKGTPTDETLKRIEKYFMKHKEYTHLILHADDAVPDYNAVAMLIADAEKYDFEVISGCCCMDKITEDMFLNLTFNIVAKKRSAKLRREAYRFLPYEFRELNGIIRVWFQGNALGMVRRDVIERIGGLKTWFHRFGGDLRFCYDCWKYGIRQYTDLRVYMDHYKYPQTIPPYNIKIKGPPRIIKQKASAPIPKAKPAKIIRTIPRKYVDLIDFYYGNPRKLRICIVTEFEQKGYFQWFEALKRFSRTPKRYGNSKVVSDSLGHILSVKSVIMNPSSMKVYPKEHEYWNPIRRADLVFVYCARHHIKDSDKKPWKWYMLPVWTKKFMKKGAKMIAQFDSEFLFLWDKNHVWWDKDVPEAKGKTPREFFKKTKVLNVADAYFTVLNDVPWAKYTKKPIYYIPLPQLFRYKRLAGYTKKRIPKNKKIAVLLHSVKTASYEHTIENVIKPLNLPVILFTTRNITHEEKVKILEKLPKGSEVYGQIPRDSYVEFLNKAYIAIDDNEGYVGWSRFAMECALYCVSCIGSTDAVKHIFPDLHTKPKDYDKQIELIRRLFSDENYYKYTRIYGYLCATRSLSDPNLIMKLLKIAFVDLGCKFEEISDEESVNESFVLFLTKLVDRGLVIPRRPPEGVETYDPVSKRIIDGKKWDELYGRWKKIIENKKDYDRCLAIARQKYMHDHNF